MSWVRFGMLKKRNPVAQDLRNPEYEPQVVPAKKGRRLVDILEEEAQVEIEDYFSDDY